MSCGRRPVQGSCCPEIPLHVSRAHLRPAPAPCPPPRPRPSCPSPQSLLVRHAPAPWPCRFARGRVSREGSPAAGGLWGLASWTEQSAFTVRQCVCACMCVSQQRLCFCHRVVFRPSVRPSIQLWPRLLLALAGLKDAVLSIPGWSRFPRRRPSGPGALGWIQSVFIRNCQRAALPSGVWGFRGLCPRVVWSGGNFGRPRQAAIPPHFTLHFLSDE